MDSAEYDSATQKNLQGRFEVTAIPATVKSFDADGKPQTWTLEKEKNECFDSNGKATFQGILHGYFNDTRDGAKSQDIETQILDCELTYNSGMAC